MSSYAPKDLLTYSTDAELWAELSEALKRGAFALAVTHVSRSGMSRRIRVLGVHSEGIADYSRHVGRLTGHRVDKDDLAVKVDGCGMDMGFHLMERLGSAWADFAGIDKPYRFGGLFANNGSAWDGDRGEIETLAPWPVVAREDGRTRKNWGWV